VGKVLLISGFIHPHPFVAFRPAATSPT